MTNRSRSEDYVPPYASYTSIFPDGWTDYVMAMIGVQIAPGANGSSMLDELAQALAVQPEPLHVERVVEIDALGYCNEIHMAYWQDAESYRQWLASAPVSRMFSTIREGGVGIWREGIVAPADNVDPCGFGSSRQWGVGRHVKLIWERYHAYYGAMRDRIPNGRNEEIEGPDDLLVQQDASQTLGRRLTVSVPHNICFIRAVLGWNTASVPQRDIFIDEMLPVYETGVYYLRDNAVDAACPSARVIKAGANNPDNGVDAETLAWFTSLKALEKWTHHHETHAAIFNKSVEIAQKFNFKVDLDIGHEVVVVPAGGVDTDYNNCHSATGLLRFYPSRDVTAS